MIHPERLPERQNSNSSRIWLTNIRGVFLPNRIALSKESPLNFHPFPFPTNVRIFNGPSWWHNSSVNRITTRHTESRWKSEFSSTRSETNDNGAKYEIVSLGRPFFFRPIFPSISYSGANFILELRTTLERIKRIWNATFGWNVST